MAITKANRRKWSAKFVFPKPGSPKIHKGSASGHLPDGFTGDAVDHIQTQLRSMFAPAEMIFTEVKVR